jgi:hypothetical protein
MILPRWSSTCDLSVTQLPDGSYRTHVKCGPTPFGSKTFTDPDQTAFRARLIALRAEGYRFPSEMMAPAGEAK